MKGKVVLKMKNTNRKTGFTAFRLPLLEMVMAVGILTIVSVLVARLFIAAAGFSGKAVELRKADTLAQNVAETIRQGGIDAAMQKYGLKKTDQNLKYFTGFSSDWKQSDKMKYVLVVELIEKHAVEKQEAGEEDESLLDGSYGVMIYIYASSVKDAVSGNGTLITSFSEAYVK